MRCFLLACTLSLAVLASAKPPELTPRALEGSLPNIIRTCCAFGADLSVGRIPFVRKTDVIAADALGNHTFLSSKIEGNGIVYTARGGFIDIGHLRDYADWTAFLYVRIKAAQASGEGLLLDLGEEGGRKTLLINTDLPSADSLVLELAGKIAFDLSVWHEIATWFGASYIPLVPERYSSFSPEDLYSNLLGVYIGQEAIRSPLPFDVAVTQILNRELADLGDVGSAECTLEAMESVEEVWWTKRKALPNGRMLLRRNVAADGYLIPWLVPSDSEPAEIITLPLPGDDLDQYFTFLVKTNDRTGPKHIPSEVPRDYLTQVDFPYILQLIEDDQLAYNLNLPHRHRTVPSEAKRRERVLPKGEKRNVSQRANR